MTALDLGPGHTIVAIVLAAGSATRFGGGKVLAPLDGQALLTHVIGAAGRAGISVTVVTPPDDRVGSVARAAGASTVINPDPSRGLSSSLAVGLSALAGSADAAVVLLADQPTIETAVIAAVIAAWRTDPASPWRIRYDDGPGHPVLLPAHHWDAATGGQGDRGAKDALDALGVREVRFSGRIPPDVDRPDDLERLMRGGAAGA